MNAKNLIQRIVRKYLGYQDGFDEGRRVVAVEIKTDLENQAQKEFESARDMLYHENILVDKITAKELYSEKYDRFFDAVDKSKKQETKNIAARAHALAIYSQTRVYTDYTWR